MILYAILRGVEDIDQYQLVYVDENYFKSTGHLDDSWNKDYAEFEYFLKQYNFEHSMDATLTIMNDMSEKEIQKLISENFENAKYSEEVYDFMYNETKDTLVTEYEWSSEDIDDWMNDIKEAKEMPVAKWRKYVIDLINELKD